MANNFDTEVLTARQRELFGALLDSFLAEGFADFTIDSAVKRFRCSKSTLYALGDSVDEIVRRTLISFFQEISRRTHIALQGHRSKRAELEAYFRCISNCLEPVSPAFMCDLATRPLARELYDANTKAATARISGMIRAGIENGEFRHASPEFLGIIVEGAMQQIQQGRVAHAVPAAQAYRELGRLVLYGIVEEKKFFL